MMGFQSAWTYHSAQLKKGAFLSTGNEEIDQLIGGGIAYGTITEIVGEAGSGKSQLCMQLAASSIACGRTVLYIDTEKGSSLKRINQLIARFSHSGDMVKNIEALKIAEPNSIQMLIIILKQVLRKEYDLIILDSVAALFKGEDLAERALDIDTIAVNLCKLASQERSAVVCTNHVTTKIDADGSSKLHPSLGAYWFHRPTSRIWMERLGNKRYIELKKCPFGQKRRAAFQIKEDGLYILQTDLLYI